MTPPVESAPTGGEIENHAPTPPAGTTNSDWLDLDFSMFRTPPPATDTNPGPVPVSQSRQTVTQTDAQEPNIAFATPDEVLRWYESEIRKEPSHLGRKDANPATVVARIHNKLRRAHSVISRMQTGAFSFEVSARFRTYLLETIEPILAEQGSPYEPMSDLVATLQHHTDREAVST